MTTPKKDHKTEGTTDTAAYTFRNFKVTQGETKGLISEIVEWGKTAKELVAQSAMFAKKALLHFHMYGDATVATALVVNMPEGFRRQSLIGWFRKSAPLVWSDKTNAFTKDVEKNAEPVLHMAEKAKDAVAIERASFLIERAFLNPYYEMFRESAIPEELFDETLETKVKNILKAYDTAKEAGLVQQFDKLAPIMDKLRDVARDAGSVKSSVDADKKAEKINELAKASYDQDKAALEKQEAESTPAEGKKEAA